MTIIHDWKKISIVRITFRYGFTYSCQLIINSVFDKNPGGIYGTTPLHFAVEKGHLDICRLIIENVKDKNPPDVIGRTPLHWAAEKGDLAISHLIICNVKNNSIHGKCFKSNQESQSQIFRVETFHVVVINSVLISIQLVIKLLINKTE